MKSVFLVFCVVLIGMGCLRKEEKPIGVVADVPVTSVRGLKTGAVAPPFVSMDIDGKVFELAKETQKGPVVLVFYRGGWCPYCNLQLRNLQAEALPEIQKLGGQLVAISVDKADEGLKTKDKEKLGMTILSDPKANLLKSFEVDYKVPDDLVEKYIKKYKIDLEAASGQKHHLIAVPAVFVINKDRKITYSYANEDYKVRAQIEDILEAVKKL